MSGPPENNQETGTGSGTPGSLDNGPAPEAALRRAAIKHACHQAAANELIFGMGIEQHSRHARRTGQKLKSVSSIDGILDTAVAFWRGTSGHAYVHTIYSLPGCPALPPACVLLVEKRADSRRVLDVINVDRHAPSLNLAEIRRAGAELGANEVHVHFAGGRRDARQTAMIDLRTRHRALYTVGH